MAESKKELKSLLMKVKEKSKKADLKLRIQKTKIMVSSPITSWQIEGEKVVAGIDFIFSGSKITIDGDWSLEVKRLLLFGKKDDKPRQCTKKHNITLLTKVCIVKSMVFPVVMWVLDHEEGWAPKNGCFWTVGLEKMFERPLDCKEITSVKPKGNQHWLFIERFDTEAEPSILWPLDAKSLLVEKDWYWEKLKAKEEGDDREWDGWMASSTQWTWVWANSGRWWRTEKPSELHSPWVTKSWTRLCYWIAFHIILLISTVSVVMLPFHFWY